jgi:hypothetical protein
VQQRPHRDSHPFASKNSHLLRQVLSNFKAVWQSCLLLFRLIISINKVAALNYEKDDGGAAVLVDFYAAD